MIRKRNFFLVAISAFTALACTQIKSKPESYETMKTSDDFYQFKLKSIDGDIIDFSRFKGKKVLIVNVASNCGFTTQYAELEELHKKYGDKIAVLGFPCNQFGGQEPGSAAEIKSFCSSNFGVSFQLFDKVDVKGSSQSPLYKWLGSKELNGWNEELPGWNFCKYLIDEKGQLIRYYNSRVKPMSQDIVGLL
jgi:glutathione peroxidase